MSPIGGISIHAFDVGNGKPAAHLGAQIIRCESNAEVSTEVFTEVSIAKGYCNDNGVLDQLDATTSPIIAGNYLARFDVGAYFAQLGQSLPDPAFLGIVNFHFGIADISQHYHLPFKFTPWGFSLFRGGL